MAHNDAKSCHIMPTVTRLLFRQHSRVFGFVYVRDRSYAGCVCFELHQESQHILETE